jgi:mono/diheme cytochrome c family protein
MPGGCSRPSHKEDFMTAAFRLGAYACGAALALGWTVHAAPVGQTDVKIRNVPAYATVSIDGKDTFTAYCASCHGSDAKGTGPAAQAFKVPVADLTTIAKRHGKFDPITVEQAISGKGKALPAHGGDPSMPVWGPVFRAMQNDAGVAQLRLTNLVKYLETIQAK